MGIETEMGLTTAQTFKIAEYAVENEYYTLAMDWLKATESKLKDETDPISVNRINLANTFKQNIEKVK